MLTWDKNIFRFTSTFSRLRNIKIIKHYFANIGQRKLNRIYIPHRTNVDSSKNCKTCKRGLEEVALFEYEIWTKFCYSDKESLKNV